MCPVPNVVDLVDLSCRAVSFRVKDNNESNVHF